MSPNSILSNRQKTRCDKQIPCGSCKRRGCDDICPTCTLLSIGRGKRSIMSHVPNLNSTIVRMGQRIRDLEEALARTQESSKSPHALWSKCVLSAQPTTKSTPTPSGDTLGSFVVNEHGETSNPRAQASIHHLIQFHSASKIIPPGRDGQLFTALTTSFPFSSSAERTPSWDPTLSLARLVIFVPSRPRGWNLCELYFHNAAWHGTPLTQPEVIDLFNLIYTRSNPSLPLEITPHQLASLFLIFALSSIVDTAVSGVDSADGDCYFGLANAALSLKKVFDFEEPELATVQALTLLACYYTYISRRFSVETAWQTISMASSLAQRVSVILQSPHLQGLFWELYACENIYALAVGRPVSIRPESISCVFPQDEEELEEGTESAPFVKPLPGYRHARWKFVKEIMAPVMDTFLAIKEPSYETILNLDLKIRKFIQTSLPALETIGLPDTDPPIKFLHRGSLRVLANQVLIFIHRDSFVEAMRISPTNPLQSPYSSSFLAAYRSAAEIVKATNHDCKRYPELLPRWYAHLESQIIVATVAIRYPNSDMESDVHFSQVIADLLETVNILDRVAGDCANHIGFVSGIL
ncbi:Zn(2)-C6 fungal-type domain-containing protein [Favolaschia claudopus]|uniref:Zn(2)-C6 fungal-type domain-containing protein n=1 Tax=Favolaschia claudopus TaxID=2862362 RepID=A0AAW0ACD0_9AGAR